jgi:hypothetical protein
MITRPDRWHWYDDEQALMQVIGLTLPTTAAERHRGVALGAFSWATFERELEEISGLEPSRSDVPGR